MIHDDGEDAKRACVPIMDVVRSSVRLAKEEVSVPLEQQSASYSENIRVTYSGKGKTLDGEEKANGTMMIFVFTKVSVPNCLQHLVDG